MNKARIVRDEENNVYLEVTHLNSKIYFLIIGFDCDIEGKIEALSKDFLVNLKGE